MMQFLGCEITRGLKLHWMEFVFVTNSEVQAVRFLGHQITWVRVSE